MRGTVALARSLPGCLRDVVLCRTLQNAEASIMRERIARWAKPVRSARRLLRKVVRHDVFVVVETDRSAFREPVAPRVDIEYRVATLEDLPNLFDWGGQPLTKPGEQWARHIISGAGWCIVALHEGRIVASRWWEFDHAEFSGLRFKLGVGWVHSRVTVTLREYRRLRIQRGLEVYQHHHLRNEHIPKSVAEFRASNGPAVSGGTCRPYQKMLARYHKIVILRRWRFVLFPRWLKTYLQEPVTAQGLSLEEPPSTIVRA